MREIQLRETKATLSDAAVDNARRGELSVIARHEKRVAVIFSFEAWERLSRVAAFGRLLMEAPIEPHDLSTRTATPLRDAGL
jgi:antitoxin (DNA-binding transcriptional repressor) of toxin-antitoxin stability system